MKKIIVKLMAMVMVAAVALPTMAQFGNQEQAVAPTTTFQSTGSTMMSSGSSYSANPTLNEDGTAAYSVASYSPARGPMRTSGTPGSPSTPGQGQQENQFPLGDAVLPMIMMALAFCGVVYLRRKKALSR